MEVLFKTCTSIAISFACILLVKMLWKVLNWVWFNPRRLEKVLRKQGFKGNPYKFFYGDSKNNAKMILKARSKPISPFSNDFLLRTHPLYHFTVKTFGTKCFIWNGRTPVVNISEPNLIREILMKRKELQKPLINPFHKMLSPGLDRLEGEMWVKRRKLLNPAFHMKKLELMLPAFARSTSDMIEKWESMASKTGSCEIELWSDFHKLSADGISRAAFGTSYQEGDKLFELITQQIRVAIRVLSSVYVPGWRFVPTKDNRKMMQIDREIKSLLKDVIDQRHKEIQSGVKLTDDLLGLLLESSCIHNGHVNGNKEDNGMSLEEVIDECKIFYLAGQGTTSILLVWTLILLGKYQAWQQRAREEVLATFGRNVPDFHGLTNLKTVNMILQEILRLYPPVTEIARIACEDVKVGDLVIPAGVQVTLPLVHVQHSEELWGPDAKEFNPERFTEGISKASGGNVCFFSFGWGPRSCIGSNFAMTEARVALVMILQRFSFELSPLYEHAPALMAGLQPQFGAPIVLKQL